ncbi:MULTISPECIES: DUF3574 domain-containing protein [Kamptonema]|uniref:DUF3574 domain-containing protein n=1 Tax=Kamptonema TaxID=1501433 RepID=UPI0001DACCEE|nr:MULTISPECIES: DUF3574 domain-containing protein [Kamptonema]CBN58707.1 putative lipoprotein [Kamptonema sp. PCC 6506]
MPKTINSLFLASFFILIPISIPTLVRAEISETSTTNINQKILIKDELYFGLTKPGGSTISDVEWQQFLNTTITPRFHEGLTVLDSYGQYLNSNSLLVTEKSKVVILIYENSPEKNRAIAEIIDIYKRTFHQESVLRVTTEAKVSF